MGGELSDIFGRFKTVICLCPECGELSRLSDMRIVSSGRTARTWLDDYEESLQKADELEYEFELQKSKIRDKAVRRGRAKVPKLVRKAMAGKFAGLSYDPYDIKPVLHPVDFVVFDGMNRNEMRDVVLLSGATRNKEMLVHKRAIKKAVRDGSYEWNVARVSTDGSVEFEE